MFYEGDLQHGISKAVQEAKLVACFVTDDGEESQLWENQFLMDDSLRDSFAEKTVLLRLKAGSQEASYLAAIFPLPKTPTLVIIRDGELKEYLASGVSKEDFLRRMQVALGSRETPQPSTTRAAACLSTTAISRSNASQASTSSNRSVNSITPASTSSNQPSAAVQELLAERSARLEAHKKEQDTKEKVKRAAEAKARREAAEQAEASGSKASADMKYAQMQKKRQQEAREERARILKRVEDDKAERREREARRKAEAKALAEGRSVESGPSSLKQAASTNSKECAIQIRLFDGSTIRSRFSSTSNLRKDIRPWIDEKQPGDVPYTFKQVLTPLPNKNIETSEEDQTLQSLGLAPSATLILLPVSGYTSAYEGNTGYVSRGVSAGYGLVSSGIGIVTGLLGGFLGGGGTAHPPAEESRTPTAAPGPSINVRTLRDQESRKDDQQFYNGNALNFEPRKDDDDKKDD